MNPGAEVDDVSEEAGAGAVRVAKMAMPREKISPNEEILKI